MGERTAVRTGSAFRLPKKRNTFAKAEAIPAVACREAYDSLYTIEGRGDAHISK